MPCVRAYRADSPLADQPFEIFASVSDAAGLDGYRRMEDLGVTHVVTFPWVFYSGFTDAVADKLDGIDRFGDEIIGVIG